MEKCPACKEPVRWYHKKGVNSSWHKICSISWNEGYITATKFCDSQNQRMGYPTAYEIYSEMSKPKREREGE